MNLFSSTIKLLILLFWVLVGFSIGCLVITLSGCQLANNELGPSALLKKYETFKDLSAKIDARAADIEVVTAQIKNLEKQYEGEKRKEWNRTDSEQLFVWQQELSGLKMSFNQMAARYNAMMVKENYRFTNQGDLPQGADKPLPREYKPYVYR
jgi:hypothetical protein